MVVIQWQATSKVVPTWGASEAGTAGDATATNTAGAVGMPTDCGASDKQNAVGRGGGGRFQHG